MSDLNKALSYITLTKYMKSSSVGLFAWMGDTNNEYRIWVTKSSGGQPLARLFEGNWMKIL
jgi:hypothetical protein